jgi:hypothetical protein
MLQEQLAIVLHSTGNTGEANNYARQAWTFIENLGMNGAYRSVKTFWAILNLKRISRFKRYVSTLMRLRSL